MSMPKRGRPRSQKTWNVRIYLPLAMKLAWIAVVERRRKTEVIDDMIRDAVDKRYSELHPIMEQMYAAGDAVGDPPPNPESKVAAAH